ncbi:MAG: dTDP-4-dehydrorhamnose reductase [Methylophilaceae bacterium]
MLKVLLTGVNGQVGNSLKDKLSAHELVAVSREQLDLTDADAIRRLVQQIKPSLIINPAAYTAVDKAESEPELAFAINATAPQILAEEAATLGAGIIHFSTDYVYDGKKSTPYVESDAVNPINIYGKSKLAGEDAIRSVGLPHLILRTSWVYGAYGKNFLKTILRLASEREKLTIVGDQFGAPTSSENIAKALVVLVNQWDLSSPAQTGVYHITNTGSTSWHGFATEIINEYNDLDESRAWPVLKTQVDNVVAITTIDYPTPAARPANSTLNTGKLNAVFGVQLPTWQKGLHEVLQGLKL